MHLKHFAFGLALAMPLTALALDFSGSNLPYSDVRKGTPEAAAVSLLTSEGVVEGYDDGTFGVAKNLNRAEFLKIVIETRYENFASVKESLQHACFPDMQANAWYAPYVCFAKNEEIVSGYPQPGIEEGYWPFGPTRAVNYAEALKILAGLFDYQLDEGMTGPWYEQYYRAAVQHGTALPGTVKFDTALTRGQMARLAAAFLAESKGMLSEYRAAERGEVVSTSSSSSSSSASSVSSSSSTSSVSSVSSVSSSTSSSSLSTFTLPSVSHFLLVGQPSDAIADGTIRSVGEPAHIRLAEVTFFHEPRSLQTVELRTENNEFIATLKQRSNNDRDDYKQFYEVQLEPEKGFDIPANTDVRVVVRANMRTPMNNGYSGDQLQVRTVRITTIGDTTGATVNHAIPAPFPAHISAFGRILNVENTGPAQGSLHTGAGLTVGSFAVTGMAMEGKQLSIKNLVFTPMKTGQVEVANWQLQKVGSAIIHPCSTGADGISCSNIPAELGLLGSSAVFELHADVTTKPGDATQSLQVSLEQPGSPSQLGSVQWTDDSGDFRWIESTAPVARGTLWK